MGTRDKQRYFNQLAAGWDALPAVEGAPEKVRAFVRRAAGDARSVLDVGCGTGLLLPALLETYPDAVITELDLAEEMLRANVAKLALSRVRHVCADGARLPFADAAFDLVLCFGVLPHFEDLYGALGELVRVLRTAGVLAIGHLMGSIELNAFHRSLDSPVAGDKLPAAATLAGLLADLRLAVTAAEEAPDWYFVRGEKLR